MVDGASENKDFAMKPRNGILNFFGFHRKSPVEAPTHSHLSPMQIKTAINTIGEVKQHEETGAYWDISGSSLKDYENFFCALGEGRQRYNSVIVPFLEKRKELGKNRYVLDLAGGNSKALRDLADLDLLQGGISTSLTDYRTAEEREFDISHNIHMIAGDMLQGSTWGKLAKEIQNCTQKNTVDLIIARPLGALKPKDVKLVIPPAVYGLLLERMLRLVSPDGGKILTQIPWNIPDEALKRYIRDMKRNKELIVRFDNNRAWHPTLELNIPRSDFDCGTLMITKNAKSRIKE